jgi:PAS domain-containing protein
VQKVAESTYARGALRPSREIVAKVVPGEWWESLPYSVMVCDRRFRLLYMNEKGSELTSKDGGRALVGTNILRCHPPKAQRRLRKILASGRPFVYTVTEKGRTKMTYEAVWRRDGRIEGLVEIHMLLPQRMPHRVRD